MDPWLTSIPRFNYGCPHYNSEFVEYILKHEGLVNDQQWRPVSKLCQVCSRPYNYILKSETIQTEGMYLFGSTENIRFRLLQLIGSFHR